ncbi:MAG: hypothetical protein JXR56_09170 [Candidatus Cloacimonetes bacterium]|nr:hypothetical protein [Candidatus Cloacimonadota bacterium]
MKDLKCTEYFTESRNAQISVTPLIICVNSIFITSIFQQGIREFCTAFRE